MEGYSLFGLWAVMGEGAVEEVLRYVGGLAECWKGVMSVSP